VAGPGETAWPTLEQAASASDAVVIGRVTAQTTLAEPIPYGGNNVAHVDVEVLDGLRGAVSGSTIRVWDAGYGSNCSVDLRPLKPGALVAMVLSRNKPEYAEYQQLMKLKVAPNDYLLVACGDYLQSIGSEQEARVVAKRLRNAVRGTQKGRRTKG
jgi:hypothetical protein